MSPSLPGRLKASEDYYNTVLLLVLWVPNNIKKVTSKINKVLLDELEELPKPDDDVKQNRKYGFLP